MRRIRRSEYDDLDIVQYKQDVQTYTNWLRLGCSDNKKELDELKTALSKAINIVLTEKQKEYMIEYYVNCLNTKQIAEKYNVDGSTVSRLICKGRKRLKYSLMFASPTILKSIMNETNENN